MNVQKLSVAKIQAGSIFNSMTKVVADSTTWVVKIPANWGFYSIDVARHSFGDYVYLAFKTKANAISVSKVLKTIDDADKFRSNGQHAYALVFRRDNGTPYMFV